VVVLGWAAPAPAPAAALGDPYLPRQWGLAQIGAPAAWARSTGAGVAIGIVDTGVDFDHEDLAGKVVAHASCIGSGGDPNRCGGSGQDDSGHGTHVAGIAAAWHDNGRGIAGVAPDATLVVAKVLDRNNGGSVADVRAGILWVVAHGARVVNLSLGDNPATRPPASDPSFQDAVESAWAAGAVPVLSAGTPDSRGPGSENFAALDALVVGATDPLGNVAFYSNPLTTAKWGLVAPGGAGTGDERDVLSTWWDAANPASTGTYTYEAGPSMAVPHVSGAVALLLAQGLSRDAAVQRILASADAVSCGGACHGRLDVAEALGVARASATAVAARAPAARGVVASSPAARPVAQPAPPVSAPPPPPPTPVTPATTVAEDPRPASLAAGRLRAPLAIVGRADAGRGRQLAVTAAVTLLGWAVVGLGWRGRRV
jgi:subtilisin family serine protease